MVPVGKVARDLLLLPKAGCIIKLGNIVEVGRKSSLQINLSFLKLVKWEREQI